MSSITTSAERMATATAAMPATNASRRSSSARSRCSTSAAAVWLVRSLAVSRAGRSPTVSRPARIRSFRLITPRRTRWSTRGSSRLARKYSRSAATASNRWPAFTACGLWVPGTLLTAGPSSRSHLRAALSLQVASGHPAVHQQRGPGDELGLPTGVEHRGGRDVVGLADSADRRHHPVAAFLAPIVAARRPHVPHSWPDVARAQHVLAHAVRAAVQCEHLSQHDDGGLGHRVQADLLLAPDPGVRGNVD